MRKSTMKGLTFDLDETGLATVFKPYQIAVMKLLYEKGSLTSGEAHSTLRHMISRASIINFLNYMVDEGYILFDERSGKGGYHRVYKPSQDSYENFIRAVYENFADRLKIDLLSVIEDV